MYLQINVALCPFVLGKCTCLVNALVCNKTKAVKYKAIHIFFIVIFLIHTYTPSLCVYAHGYGDFNSCIQNSSILFILNLILILIYI